MHGLLWENAEADGDVSGQRDFGQRCSTHYSMGAMGAVLAVIAAAAAAACWAAIRVVVVVCILHMYIRT